MLKPALALLYLTLLLWSQCRVSNMASDRDWCLVSASETDGWRRGDYVHISYSPCPPLFSHIHKHMVHRFLCFVSLCFNLAIWIYCCYCLSVVGCVMDVAWSIHCMVSERAAACDDWTHAQWKQLVTKDWICIVIFAPNANCQQQLTIVQSIYDKWGWFFEVWKWVFDSGFWPILTDSDW